MKVMTDDAPERRPERPGTKMLHDEENVRVIRFRVEPGQAVPPHTSDSTVVVQVLEGEGIFRGEPGEARLGPGRTAVYAPGELHSMEPAGDAALHFLAILTPGPR